MVTMLKVLNVFGIISATGSCSLSLYQGKFNEWTAIALVLFISSLFQTLHIEKLENRLKNNL